MEQGAIQQRSFEGWAVVDVLGHQRYAGYVRTEYFGSTAFLRVTTPARAPKERVLESDQWLVDFGHCPNGSRVQESGRDLSERFIGAGSIYGFELVSESRALEVRDEIDPPTPVAVFHPNGEPIKRPINNDDDLPY